MLTVLDLFSGIGGFSLGLERTGGFKTVAFCEIDPFCRKVLTKHWPEVLIHEDVTTLRGEDVGTVDVICGGFPCQDVSVAGSRAGITGARSGLWVEFARLICEIRPKYVLVENVPGLLSSGLQQVLGDLASLGFDAEWQCISAAAIGAPHERDRVWIIAYASGERMGIFAGSPASQNLQRHVAEIARGRFARTPWAAAVSFAGNPTKLVQDAECWSDVDGVSKELDSFGNSVVPQVVEVIGHAILSD